jgi:hypothetical protein
VVFSALVRVEQQPLRVTHTVQKLDELLQRTNPKSSSSSSHSSESLVSTSSTNSKQRANTDGQAPLQALLLALLLQAVCLLVVHALHVRGNTWMIALL